MDYVIGIGDYLILRAREDDRIVTHALASCVAVTFYSETAKVAGMIHIALPVSRERTISPARLGYYADTGLSLMFDKLLTEHRCNLKQMTVRLIGGANSINPNDSFRIGEHNINQIKRILNEKGIHYNDEETGGLFSRTVRLEVCTGNVQIQYQAIVI